MGESPFPHGGKASNPKRGVCGEEGVSLGMLLGAGGYRVPRSCGRDTPALPRRDGDNGMAPGVLAGGSGQGGHFFKGGMEPLHG